jgi:hypothetical protein
MDLSAIPGYFEDDWHRDRQAEATGVHLVCPNCARGEWFHPLGIPPDDGAERKYRLCKVCGFWQEADGTPAYRSVMTIHTCLGAVAGGRKCPNCGIVGPRHWHMGCIRVMPPQELNRTCCRNCGVLLTPQHVVPWPVAAT